MIAAAEGRQEGGGNFPQERQDVGFWVGFFLQERQDVIFARGFSCKNAKMRCEGEGLGGVGNGLAMPESGLTLDTDGEERGSVGAELPLSEFEVWDGGDDAVVADLGSS